MYLYQLLIDNVIPCSLFVNIKYLKKKLIEFITFVYLRNSDNTRPIIGFNLRVVI